MIRLASAASLPTSASLYLSICDRRKIMKISENRNGARTYVPCTARCHTHSWACANMSHSNPLSKDSDMSSGTGSLPLDARSFGSAVEVKYDSVPAAFWLGHIGEHLLCTTAVELELT